MSTPSPAAVSVISCTTDTERDAAMKIRFEVFVDEQKVPADLEPDEYDAVALHLLALDSTTGEPIGTARVVEKEGSKAKIGRVAVRQTHRGRGVGDALMAAALAAARERGLKLAMLDAQIQVIPFYERLGFVAEGPIFDDAGIPHRHMTKSL